MIDLETRFVRRTGEVDEPGIYITNYERLRQTYYLGVSARW